MTDWADEVRAEPVKHRPGRVAPRLKKRAMSKHNRNKQVKYFKTHTYELAVDICPDGLTERH